MRRISILSITIALLGAIVGCSEPRTWSAVYFKYYGHFNIGVEMEDLADLMSTSIIPGRDTDTVYISHQIADSILQGIKEIKMSKEQISVFDQIFLFKTENADISLNYHDNHCGIKVGGKIRYGTISNRIGYLMKRETLFFNNFEKEGLRERDSGIKEFGIPSTYSYKKYNPAQREIPSKVLIIIE